MLRWGERPEAARPPRARPLGPVPRCQRAPPPAPPPARAEPEPEPGRRAGGGGGGTRGHGTPGAAAGTDGHLLPPGPGSVRRPLPGKARGANVRGRGQPQGRLSCPTAAAGGEGGGTRRPLGPGTRLGPERGPFTGKCPGAGAPGSGRLRLGRGSPPPPSTRGAAAGTQRACSGLAAVPPAASRRRAGPEETPTQGPWGRDWSGPTFARAGARWERADGPGLGAENALEKGARLARGRPPARSAAGAVAAAARRPGARRSWPGPGLCLPRAAAGLPAGRQLPAGAGASPTSPRRACPGGAAAAKCASLRRSWPECVRGPSSLPPRRGSRRPAAAAPPPPQSGASVAF
ncbi:collagen alpha-1(III) chain-like [Sarcophilus harrisii]|uniref:collagen alpha-1(III) chain-like n=1 Tax=Sarcophilus harrisii TaxID=9305 RepID=UPI00130203D4|nr:collagen alpha-1(III) chain-like [Sarcophilus harrisii]